MVSKSCLVAKLGVLAPGLVSFSNTETLSELEFAVTRSSFPSPFRLPTVIEVGMKPVAKSCLGKKLGWWHREQWC